jgi:hypothetical protein
VIGLGDRFGEAVKEFLHGPGVDLRQDQREGVVGSYLRGSEDVSEGESLVGRSEWTLALHVPAMADAAFLANARFVLKEDAQPLVRTFTDDFLQDVRSPFLKASAAAVSFFGWVGLAFCRLNPSHRRMRPTDVGS